MWSEFASPNVEDGNSSVEVLADEPKVFLEIVELGLAVKKR